MFCFFSERGEIVWIAVQMELQGGYINGKYKQGFILS